MKFPWLTLTALILTSCSAGPPGPPAPDRPECAKPEKAPIDGGLGGTGNREDDPCAEQARSRT